eukprot:5920849-Amphidinium_carterae.1
MNHDVVDHGGGLLGLLVCEIKLPHAFSTTRRSMPILGRNGASPHATSTSQHNACLCLIHVEMDVDN